MRSLSNKQVFKALLLAGGASTFAMAAPAVAQEEGASQEDRIVVTGSRIQRPDYSANSPTVTVDETFLRQSSTAAVEEQLNRLPQFVISQSSTFSNTGEGTGGPLPAGGDIQPNATNTPGAATVSLRGVGANRTLVLIDGRRGTPGNANGSVDVSTIPSAALQRVEIVSGGASATYGADAVAGVTNFILKRDFQGIELDFQGGINQVGAGFEYQIGGIMGTDFPDGRGNVSVAMSVNTREDLYQRDLDNYQRLWNDPERTAGGFFFVPRPGVSGLGLTNNFNPATPATPGCETQAPPRGCVITNYFAGANPTVANNAGSVYVNRDGSLFLPSSAFGGGTFAQRGAGAAFYKPWEEFDAVNGTAWKTGTNGQFYALNTLTPAVVPSTRYNFLARGNYEINDWIGVFAQGMFSNSNTYSVQEAGGAQGGWDIIIPWGSGKYTGEVPNPLAFLGRPNYQNPAVPSAVIQTQSVVNGAIVTTFAPNPAFINRYTGILPCATPGNPGYNPTGCTNTEAFQAVIPDTIETLLNARPNPNAAVQLAGFYPNPRENYSDVTTYTLIAGLEGSIPGTDWTWEAFVNHGVSRTISRQTGMYSLQRARAVFSAPNFGQNFNSTSNQFSGGFGAANGRCTTGLRFFQGYEGISDDCRAAIAEDNTNIGTSRQTIVEANLQGGLFDIPWTSDQVRFALGASYREARYEFLPAGAASAGRAFLDSIVGIYPGTLIENTGIDTKEIYGELLIPLLNDLPFIQSLNLEVGGRLSDYNTTGLSKTFKILGDWQVTDWLRFRGGFNRAERAPNIAEQKLLLQQQFAVDPIGDVCSTRHNNPLSAGRTANPSGSFDSQAVCQALIARDNGGVYVPVTDTNSYYNSAFIQQRQVTGGGGFSFAPRVGNAVYREQYNPGFAALEPEVADTYTLGAVIQSPFSSGPLSRLNMTIDYFNITIANPIGTTSAGGQLLRCISAFYNPAVAGVAAGATTEAQLDSDAAIRARANAAINSPDSTCATVGRVPTTGNGQNGGFNEAAVVGSYSNQGRIELAGIDATLSWGTDLGPGSLFVSLNGNYMMDFKIQAQDGLPLLEYVGTTGTGALGVNSGSSFEYRIFGTAGYTWGPASLSVQWQHIPKTEDGNEVNFLNGLTPTGTDQSGLPAYNVFHLNTSYQLNDVVRLRLGIDNFLDIKPPLTNIDVNIDRSLGQLPGGSYSGFHDVLGRRFSFGANIRF